MKKKLFMLLLSATAAICCAFGLAACDLFGGDKGDDQGGNGSQGDHTHNYTESVVEPTCTERGYTLHTCDCGEEFKDGYKAALGHSYSDFTVTEEATCVKGEVKTHECNRCGETETVTGNPLGHSFVNYVSDGNATCLTDGTHTAKCDRCEITDTKDDKNSAIKHDFKNGICSICSQKEPTEGLQYTLSEDKTFYIASGMGSCTLTDIVIADFYEGLPVKQIGNAAFKECDSLTSVIIPDNITKIDYEAFKFCENITQLTIGQGVREIADWAFDACRRLESLFIPASVKTISSYSFYECTSLESIKVDDKNEYYFSKNNCLVQKEYKYLILGCNNSIIPDDDRVEIIGTSAFSGCNLFKDILIPDNIKQIDNSAFSGCSKLMRVTVGRNVESISTSAFYNCFKLFEVCNLSKLSLQPELFSHSSFNVNIYTPESGESKLYCTDDGYCFFKENGKNYLFSYDGNESNLVLPDYCKGENYALYPDLFIRDNSIISISIGKGVEEIGRCALSACGSLEEIYYNAVNCKDLNSWGADFITASGGEKGIRVIIGNAVERIPANLFNVRSTSWINKTSIVRVDFEEESKCKVIAERAFRGARIRSVTLPDSVEELALSAFGSCEKLASITFGKNLENLIGRDFNECYHLVEIYNYSDLDLNEILYSPSRYDIYTLPEQQSKLSTTTDGFVFYEKNGEVFLIDYVGQSKDLMLPKDYNGKKYALHEYAFFDFEAYHFVEPNYGFTSLTISEGVTNIGSRSFYGCNNLKSITVDKNNPKYYSEGNCLIEKASNKLILGCVNSIIPNNVTEICEGAFYAVHKLESITIPSSVKIIGASAFFACTYLNKIVFNEGLEEIGNSAFSRCENLRRIVLPESLKVIESGSFSYCNNLSEISLPENLLEISSSAFDNTAFSEDKNNWSGDVLYMGKYLISAKDTLKGRYEIKDGTTLVAMSAFFNCEGLTEIIFPESIEIICRNAFANCQGLTRVIIPEGVTTINSGVFSGCSSLQEVVLPEGVTTVGSYIFSECNALKALTLPDSVTEIASDALQGSRIENLKLPASAVKVISGSYIKKYLKTVVITSGTLIEEYAFSACSELLSVTIPETITEIGEYAFHGCYKLVEVYNLSALEVTIGSQENGYLGCYALRIYSSAEENSKIVTTSDGYVIFEDGEKTYLLGYEGSETKLVLPEKFNGKNYSIYDYALQSLAITQIIIPESITACGSGILFGCTDLKFVFFAGNYERAWELGIQGADGSMSTVYCYSETKPTEEGKFWHYVDGEAVVW